MSPQKVTTNQGMQQQTPLRATDRNRWSLQRRALPGLQLIKLLWLLIGHCCGWLETKSRCAEQVQRGREEGTPEPTDSRGTSLAQSDICLNYWGKSQNTARTDGKTSPPWSAMSSHAHTHPTCDTSWNQEDLTRLKIQTLPTRRMKNKLANIIVTLSQYDKAGSYLRPLHKWMHLNSVFFFKTV